MSIEYKQTPETDQPYAYAVLETTLIFAGIFVLLFFLPHQIFGDGTTRFHAISQLINQGKLSDMPYSIVGPLFSLPFWLLGKFYKSPAWWCARFNFFVFTFGIILLLIIRTA